MLLALSLFAFWTVLSGKFDAFHLGVGAAASVGIAAAVRSLFRLEPALTSIGPRAWLRWPGYLLWLAKEVVSSTAQVVRVVLDPRLPISPRIVRVRCSLPHPTAKLTLANSITMTPGTVTLDVEGDEFVVHALTEEAARGVLREGETAEMPRRVAALFEGSR